MPPAFVQSYGNATNGSGANTASLTFTPTTGNTGVVLVFASSSSANNPCNLNNAVYTDSAGNKWRVVPITTGFAKAFPSSGNTMRVFALVSNIASGGSSTTLTVTFLAGLPYTAIYGCEFSGTLSTWDQAASNHVASAGDPANPTGVTITPSQSGAVVFGYMVENDSTTVGSGWTSPGATGFNNTLGFSIYGYAMYQFYSGSGTVTPTTNTTNHSQQYAAGIFSLWVSSPKARPDLDHSYGTALSGTTVASLTLTSVPLTAGNTGVVVVFIAPGGATATVADNLGGNTWTEVAGSVETSSGRGSLFVCSKIATGGTATITATFSVSKFNVAMAGAEFSNCTGTVDVSTGGATASSTTPTLTATTTNSNEMYVGWFNNASTQVMAPGPGATYISDGGDYQGAATQTASFQYGYGGAAGSTSVQSQFSGTTSAAGFGSLIFFSPPPDTSIVSSGDAYINPYFGSKVTFGDAEILATQNKVVSGDAYVTYHPSLTYVNLNSNILFKINPNNGYVRITSTVASPARQFVRLKATINTGPVNLSFANLRAIIKVGNVKSYVRLNSTIQYPNTKTVFGDAVIAMRVRTFVNLAGTLVQKIGPGVGAGGSGGAQGSGSYPANAYVKLTATIVNPLAGAVTTVTLSTGGLGYAVGDTFKIIGGAGPGGIAIYAHGTVTSVGGGGVVTGFTMTNMGSGYVTTTSAATKTLTGSGAGLTVNIGAAPSAGTITSGGVSTIGVGSVDPPGGGTGYAVGNTFIILGGTGGTGIVTAVGPGGVVTGVSITNPGTGYTSQTAAPTQATSGTGTGLTLALGAAGDSTQMPGQGYTAADDWHSSDDALATYNPGSLVQLSGGGLVAPVNLIITAFTAGVVSYQTRTRSWLRRVDAASSGIVTVNQVNTHTLPNGAIVTTTTQTTQNQDSTTTLTTIANSATPTRTSSVVTEKTAGGNSATIESDTTTINGIINTKSIKTVFSQPPTTENLQPIQVKTLDGVIHYQWFGGVVNLEWAGGDTEGQTTTTTQTQITPGVLNGQTVDQFGNPILQRTSVSNVITPDGKMLQTTTTEIGTSKDYGTTTSQQNISWSGLQKTTKTTTTYPDGSQQVTTKVENQLTGDSTETDTETVTDEYGQVTTTVTNMETKTFPDPTTGLMRQQTTKNSSVTKGGVTTTDKTVTTTDDFEDSIISQKIKVYFLQEFTITCSIDETSLFSLSEVNITTQKNFALLELFGQQLGNANLSWPLRQTLISQFNAANAAIVPMQLQALGKIYNVVFAQSASSFRAKYIPGTEPHAYELQLILQSRADVVTGTFGF